MTGIIRWDPNRDLQTFQDRMRRMFSEFWGQVPGREDEAITGSWYPAVDVRETADLLEINAEVAGMDPKDVQVSVESGILTIKGHRNFEKATEGETYHRVERSYGAFERSFTLPNNVDPDRIKAVYRHGVLNLTLPKREEAKPKAISIKVQDN